MDAKIKRPTGVIDRFDDIPGADRDDAETAGFFDRLTMP